MKTPQLTTWKGKFGEDYIDRNLLTEEKKKDGTEGFKRIFSGIQVESVLEVGSNIGNNLHFLRAVLGDGVKIFSVEPNEKAYNILTSESGPKVDQAWNCDGFSLPVEDGAVDLAFTAGVLIHVDPDDLPDITGEIVRASRRYVLCIEYFSHTPEALSYRDHEGLLFKRDFGAFYLDQYPQLKIRDYGFLWKRELPVFDNVNWWLFEKVS